MKTWQLRDWVAHYWCALMKHTLCRAGGHRWRPLLHGRRCTTCMTFSAR